MRVRPCEGLVRFWATELKLLKDINKVTFFPVFFLRPKPQILQRCGQENGKNKLKQIGKTPVFPRTICDEHFSNQ